MHNHIPHTPMHIHPKQTSAEKPKHESSKVQRQSRRSMRRLLLWRRQKIWDNLHTAQPHLRDCYKEIKKNIFAAAFLSVGGVRRLEQVCRALRPARFEAVNGVESGGKE